MTTKTEINFSVTTSSTSRSIASSPTPFCYTGKEVLLEDRPVHTKILPGLEPLSFSTSSLGGKDIDDLILSENAHKDMILICPVKNKIYYSLCSFVRYIFFLKPEKNLFYV